MTTVGKPMGLTKAYERGEQYVEIMGDDYRIYVCVTSSPGGAGLYIPIDQGMEVMNISPTALAARQATEFRATGPTIDELDHIKQAEEAANAAALENMKEYNRREAERAEQLATYEQARNEMDEEKAKKDWADYRAKLVQAADQADLAREFNAQNKKLDEEDRQKKARKELGASLRYADHLRNKAKRKFEAKWSRQKDGTWPLWLTVKAVALYMGMCEGAFYDILRRPEGKVFKDTRRSKGLNYLYDRIAAERWLAERGVEPNLSGKVEISPTGRVRRRRDRPANWITGSKMCTHGNRDGSACGAVAKEGSDWCSAHNNHYLESNPITNPPKKEQANGLSEDFKDTHLG